MNVLVIGKGGREHALCWALEQDINVSSIYVYPGNPGTAKLNKTTNLDLTFECYNELALWAKKNQINLCIVGPEEPLNNGIVDCFETHQIKTFGPHQNTAQLESSKAFAKNIMHKANIPTARYKTVHSFKKAIDYVNTLSFPHVLKYDGLAGGKGVVICHSSEEAVKFCKRIFIEQEFSKKNNALVFEEFLQGEELSYFALCKGEIFYFFGDAQDHKRLNDGDLGPNTGGMGAYSPTQLLSKDLKEKIEKKIVAPLLKQMQKENMPYQGFLYVGLMLTQEGPKVIEFNVRLGDPEAQCILRRLKSPLGKVCLDILNSKNSEQSLHWNNKKSLVITLASEGYPRQKVIQRPIHIKDSLDDSVYIFHSATQIKKEQLYSSGGRVLTVSTLGESYQKAADKAYATIKNNIQFKNVHFRTDIAKSVLNHDHS